MEKITGKTQGNEGYGSSANMLAGSKRVKKILPRRNYYRIMS
jgi:hypothetical protein